MAKSRLFRETLNPRLDLEDEAALSPFPCPHTPSSEEKIAELARRARSREELFHPRDRRLDQGTTINYRSARGNGAKVAAGIVETRPDPGSEVYENSYTFSARLLKLRQARGWCQTFLARRAEVPKSTIASIEGGDSRSPRIDIVMKLARALRVSLDTLVGWEGQ